MHVVTGTEHTRTEHSTGASMAGVVLSVGIPLVIALIGIWQFGLEAISWPGALVWGIVGALGLWMTLWMFQQSNMTRLSIPGLLGSMFARSSTQEAFWTGLIVHLFVGALLGATWVYLMLLLNWPMNWATGLVWGVVVWLHGLLFLTSVGGVHPEIRDGRQDDPGPGGVNLGRWTPGVYLLAHIVYGVLLGGLYSTWPLT